MILVDTSVWVNHLRRGNDALGSLLEAGEAFWSIIMRCWRWLTRTN